MTKFLTVLAVFLSLNFSVQARKNAPKWVTNRLQSMPLREKIGQMIMPWMEGGFKNFQGPEFQRLKIAVAKYKVGGFIIFRGNPSSVAGLTNQLQDLSKTPLLFAADYESGLPTQAGMSGTFFPSNMGLAATQNTDDAYLTGKIIAQESRAIGIRWIFAPVADVNNNPDNPVINTRSFGEDPIKVGEFVSSLTRGIQDAGALATLKHFPGHGDTSVDSHLALPLIPANLKRLEEVELIPFKMGIEAGVKSIMAAHVTVSGLGGDLPASLNPKIGVELLRNKLQYQGLLVTDAMEMGAVVNSFSEERSIILAVLAGADVILIPLNFENAINTIEKAVKNGEISLSRIDDSVRKILTEKYYLGLHRQKKINPLAVHQLIQRPENIKIGQGIAERSITLLRNEDKIFPVKFPITKAEAAETLFILLCSDALPSEVLSKDAARTRGRDLDLAELDVASLFKMEIWNRASNTEIETSLNIIQLDKRSSTEDFLAASNKAKKAKKVIIVSFVRRAAGKGTVALPENQVSFIESLVNSTEIPLAFFALGSPYQIRQFPNIRNYALGYGLERSTLMASARALFGEIPFTGKLPIRIPDLFSVGAGLTTSLDGPLK